VAVSGSERVQQGAGNECSTTNDNSKRNRRKGEGEVHTRSQVTMPVVSDSGKVLERREGIRG
jgi:hypothetical protein